VLLAARARDVLHPDLRPIRTSTAPHAQAVAGRERAFPAIEVVREQQLQLTLPGVIKADMEVSRVRQSRFAVAVAARGGAVAGGFTSQVCLCPCSAPSMKMQRVKAVVRDSHCNLSKLQHSKTHCSAASPNCPC
jgi:hypothetical protein